MAEREHDLIGSRELRAIRNLINKIAKARGSDVSSVIRQAVHQELARLSFLTDEEKKALGLG